MKVGLVLPQGYFNEFEGWEPGRAWDRIVELAQTAERLGFESIWTGEHVAVEVAGRVDRVRLLGPVVGSRTARAARRDRPDRPELDVPQPGHHREQAGTLDAISGGRLTLGLGAGFKENEAAAFRPRLPELKDRMEWLSEHFEIIWRATRTDEPGSRSRDLRPCR